VVVAAAVRGDHVLDHGPGRAVEAEAAEVEVGAEGDAEQVFRPGVHQHGPGPDVQHDDPVAHRVDELARQRALVVELGEVGLAIGHQPALATRALDHGEQVRGDERLGQEVEGALPHHLDRGLDGGKRRDDHHHRAVARVLRGEAGHLESVDAGHLQVDQGDVVLAVGEQAERRFTVVGGVDLVAHALQDAAHPLPHALLVVDDQQLHDARSGGSRMTTSKHAPPPGRFDAAIEPPCILTMP
jgi:hypothetical protein